MFLSKFISFILFLGVVNSISCRVVDSLEQVSHLDEPTLDIHSSIEQKRRSLALNANKEEIENYKVICQLYLKYDDLLRMNGIMTPSQRHIVMRIFQIIKNIIKHYLHEHPAPAKKILSYMKEQHSQGKQSNKGDYNLLVDRLPFKWG